MRSLERELESLEAEYGQLWWVGISEGEDVHVVKRGTQQSPYLPETNGHHWVLPVFTQREIAQEFAETEMRQPEAFITFLEADGVDLPRVLIEKEWSPHETDWAQVSVLARQMAVDLVAINFIGYGDDDDPTGLIPVPKSTTDKEVE